MRRRWYGAMATTLLLVLLPIGCTGEEPVEDQPSPCTLESTDPPGTTDPPGIGGPGVPLLLQAPHGQLDSPVVPWIISQRYTGPYPRHSGIDLAGPYGSPVRAVAHGTVIGIWRWNYSYGYHVLVQHHGGRSLYAHLSGIVVHVGQQVARGQVLGGRDSTGRSTGNHLHFELIRLGRQVNPAPYIWGPGTGSGDPSCREWDGHDGPMMNPDHFLHHSLHHQEQP